MKRIYETVNRIGDEKAIKMSKNNQIHGYHFCIINTDNPIIHFLNVSDNNLKTITTPTLSNHTHNLPALKYKGFHHKLLLPPPHGFVNL